jgi:hypothetical protein
VHAGRSWELLEGLEGGQTQADAPDGDGEPAVWAHPLDLHYACRGLDGWPRLSVHVYELDAAGRSALLGYGFCHVPTAPGVYELDCPTWLPEVCCLCVCCVLCVCARCKTLVRASLSMPTAPHATAPSNKQTNHKTTTKKHARAAQKGTLGERIASFFVGGAPRLACEEVVHAPGDRFRLQTVAAGIVQLQLGGSGLVVVVVVFVCACVCA